MLTELHIDGYDCFCSDFTVHSRGVCIYISSALYAQKHEQLSYVQSGNVYFAQHLYPVCSVSWLGLYTDHLMMFIARWSVMSDS